MPTTAHLTAGLERRLSGPSRKARKVDQGELRKNGKSKKAQKSKEGEKRNKKQSAQQATEIREAQLKTLRNFSLCSLNGLGLGLGLVLARHGEALAFITRAAKSFPRPAKAIGGNFAGFMIRSLKASILGATGRPT